MINRFSFLPIALANHPRRTWIINEKKSSVGVGLLRGVGAGCGFLAGKRNVKVDGGSGQDVCWLLSEAQRQVSRFQSNFAMDHMHKHIAIRSDSAGVA